MNKRKILLISSSVVTFCVIILLVTGSSLLSKALDTSNSVPLGTFITWAGMISLPLTIYWSVKELRKPSKKLNKILSGFLKFIIILAILWLPLSYLLAGNLAFNFSEKRTFQGGQIAMKWFWHLSYGIGIGAVLTLLIYWVSLLFKKNKTVNENA